MKYMKRYHEFILENKIYGKKQIELVSNKIGDNSEETVNKLQIFGLFRHQQPFNVMKDISTIDIQQLTDLFDRWYNKVIVDFTVDSNFGGDKKLIEKYLNAFIKNISKLGNNAKPFRKAEELVDIVNNNKWIKQEISLSKNNLYDPHSDDILFENDKILIIKAPSKAKCVIYGEGETWCISQKNLNYYVTYRINYGASIYFVLQKDVDNHEHKLVILNYGERGYGIADRSNAGNRHGGPDIAMTWDNVEKELPNLKGLEHHFVYRPVGKDEARYEKLVDKPIKVDDIQAYIEPKIKRVKIDGIHVTVEEFLRDYSTRHKFTINQFNGLPSDLKLSIIETGYTLPEACISSLSKPEQIRYYVVMLKKGKINDAFFDLSEDDQFRILSNGKENLTPNIVSKILEKSNDLSRINSILPDEALKYLGSDDIWKILSNSQDIENAVKLLPNDPYISPSDVCTVLLRGRNLEHALNYIPKKEYLFSQYETADLLGKFELDFILPYIHPTSLERLNNFVSILRDTKNPSAIIDHFNISMDKWNFDDIIRVLQGTTDVKSILPIVPEKFFKNIDKESIVKLLQNAKDVKHIIPYLRVSNEHIKKYVKDKLNIEL